jgi:hypothetical protein
MFHSYTSAIIFHIMLDKSYYHVMGGPSWPWSYGSWIYNYLCNQCLSPLMLVWILLSARRTTLFDKVCKWLEASQWFSLGTPISSTNKTDSHDIHSKWNIVESGIKPHKTNQTKIFFSILWFIYYIRNKYIFLTWWIFEILKV